MRRLVLTSMLFCAVVVWAQAEDAMEYEEGMEFKPELGLKGMAGKIGLLYLEADYGFVPAFGLWADLGNLAQEISLDASVEYWSAEKELEKGADIYYLKNIAIHATIKYNFPLDEKWSPFVGAGLGIGIYMKDAKYSGSHVGTDPKLDPHIDMGTRFNIHPKIDLEGRIKITISDVGSYGLYISGLFKTD